MPYVFELSVFHVVSTKCLDKTKKKISFHHYSYILVCCFLWTKVIEYIELTVERLVTITNYSKRRKTFRKSLIKFWDWGAEAPQYPPMSSLLYLPSAPYRYRIMFISYLIVNSYYICIIILSFNPLLPFAGQRDCAPILLSINYYL